ncbi:hypothetical protein RUM43_006014 [Polyplax serrata]|uniref:NADH dehydrogenase [ubiquinone] 1 alpha subcomplex subunit 6 n=1 Tax=Polyplax serrata TaxID=468196 RepID=A0AAN8PC06_POLSC
MAFQPVKSAIRQVKPLISTDQSEAKRRVINLYKAWYRHIPVMVIKHKLPLTISHARGKLKNEFVKHKDLKDIRVIDMLVIKGEMELKEVVTGWKQKCHVMYMVQDTTLPRPTTFMSKFLAGSD